MKESTINHLMRRQKLHKSERRAKHTERRQKRVSGKSVFLLAKIIREKSK